VRVVLDRTCATSRSRESGMWIPVLEVPETRCVTAGTAAETSVWFRQGAVVVTGRHQDTSETGGQRAQRSGAQRAAGHRKQTGRRGPRACRAIGGEHSGEAEVDDALLARDGDPRPTVVDQHRGGVTYRDTGAVDGDMRCAHPSVPAVTEIS